MSPADFEPTISGGERPQTYALDRAVTGTGSLWGYWVETRKLIGRDVETRGNVLVCDIIPEFAKIDW